VHEMSHEVAGTRDFDYGTADSKSRARTDPGKAIRNADNYEYFAERAP